MNSADVIAVFEEMSGKAVAEGVTTGTLVDAGPLDRFPDRFLQAALVYVMAVDGPRARVF